MLRRSERTGKWKAPEEMLPNLLANNSQSKINLAATQVAQLAPRAFVIVTNEASSPSPAKTKQVVPPSLSPSPPLPTVCGCVMKSPLSFQVVCLMIRFAWFALQLARLVCSKCRVSWAVGGGGRG